MRSLATRVPGETSVSAIRSGATRWTRTAGGGALDAAVSPAPRPPPLAFEAAPAPSRPPPRSPPADFINFGAARAATATRTMVQRMKRRKPTPIDPDAIRAIDDLV